MEDEPAAAPAGAKASYEMPSTYQRKLLAQKVIVKVVR